MLTPSQQRALAHTHHLSVTANAGSGKTRVLVERYVSILLGGAASVGEVVALTFTEKAASELKRKIAARIAELSRSPVDDTVQDRLAEIRAQLSSAAIGTIHSFCARILREFPVEAGVDAGFTVLEGVDQALLLDEAIKAIFDEILKRHDETRDRLFEILRTLGKAAVLRIVHACAEQRELVDRLVGVDGIYARSDEAILMFWESQLVASVDQILQSSALRSKLERLITLAAGKQADTARDAFNRFIAAGATREQGRAFSELMGIMFKKDGGLYKAFIGAAADEYPGKIEREAEEISTQYAMVRPLLEWMSSEDQQSRHRTLLGLTRTLLSVHALAMERYRDSKDAASQLDFDDLQLRVKELLDREPVRAQLAKRYKFVMVDEYQDTNALQYEILLPLLDRLTSGNLFIVGDPKQSIYAFRHADVAVFNRTREDITAASGSEGAVLLGESFRPLKDIAAFVNVVFSTLMIQHDNVLPAGSPEYGVVYDPLVKARRSDENGQVQVIIRSQEDAEEGVSEADLIVRQILALVESKAQVFDSEEHGRPVSFGDIAILLRSRTPLAEVEEALIKYHVPYLITGGIGYFQTQDTFDFYNYLQFVLDPGDDIALAGVLRSPFYHVSDAELYELAADRKGASLWEFLERASDRLRHFPAAEKAVRMLRTHLALGLRISPHELVARIVEDTLYVPKVAAGVRGEQSLANLEKLQRFAQGFDELGFTGLFDFTRRLGHLIEHENREGQANVDQHGDAVQVMTIHAAKGLEFRVVVLPYLDRQFRYDTEPYIDGLLGLGFGYIESGEEKARSPMLEYLQTKSKLKTIGEEKRIFYVACTRARDILLLSGSERSRGRGDSYFRWMFEAFNEEIETVRERLGWPVRLPVIQHNEGAFRREDIDHDLVIRVLRSKDVPQSRPLVLAPDATVAARRSFISQIPRESKGEVFSATKIRTYETCPSLYKLRYILGLQSGTGRGAREDDDNEVAFDASEVGRLFHAVMERIDVLGQDRKRMMEELEAIANAERLVVSPQTTDLIRQVANLVSEVQQCSFWQQVATGTAARTEFSITTMFGEEYLFGTLDRLYKAHDGVWTVLDYKTDSLALQSVSGKAEEYQSQLNFYALLVSRFFDVKRVRGCLLFANRPTEPFVKEYDDTALADIESEISRVIAGIKARNFTPSVPPCHYCPYSPKGCQMVVSQP